MKRATNTEFVVGGLIKKDNKFLLVQEAKQSCYGQWNLPAGHVEIGETVFEAVKREIREETGCEAEIKEICHIGNRVHSDRAFILIIFVANLVTEHINIAMPDEILAVHWFSYEEIHQLAQQGKIRNPTCVLGAIDNYRQGISAPLKLITVYPNI